MLIAKVIGTTVSTIKDEKIVGLKLLIVRQADENGEPFGKPTLPWIRSMPVSAISF